MLAKVQMQMLSRVQNMVLLWMCGCMRCDSTVWTRMYRAPTPNVSMAPTRCIANRVVFWERHGTHLMFGAKIRCNGCKSVCFDRHIYSHVDNATFFVHWWTEKSNAKIGLTFLCKSSKSTFTCQRCSNANSVRALVSTCKSNKKMNAKIWCENSVR